MEWNASPSVALSASAASSSSAVQDADLIIVGVFAPPAKDDDDDGDEKEDKEEDMEPIVFTGIAKRLDEELGGALTELAVENSKAFQNGGSAAGSMTPALRIASAATTGGKTKRYILLGLGAEGKVSNEGVPPKMEASSIMKVGGAIASAIHEQKKITTCNVLLPSKITEGITSKSMLTDFSTAYYSGLYVDNRYRTGKKIELKAENVRGVTLYLENTADNDDDFTTIGQEAIATGLAIASGCSLTKDIVNAPHNVLNSESLAETAQRIAAESGGSITCTILGKEECEARGMGAYLGVARGSETEPQFIHLTYKPEGEIK
jgi:leucyl aminopeptidase